MRFFGIDPTKQKRLAILIPMIALALSLFVVLPMWQRYGDEVQSVEKLERDLRERKAAVVLMMATPSPREVSAVEDVPAEQPQFLEQIRGLATAAHCRLMGFEALPPRTVDPDSPIRAVRARLILEARYSDIRVLVDRLKGASRLFAITDVDITIPPAVSSPMANQETNSGMLSAVVEVERYVIPATQKVATGP